MKPITNIPELKQGDLLYVNLTGSKLKSYKGQPPIGRGWLCVTEVSVDKEIISACFCQEGGSGYGAISWPEFECYAFLRGAHGQTSPFAALNDLFDSRTIAVALTT